MIRVNYLRSETHHRLAVEGHAGYDDSGRDIVCAGISSITCALMNFLPNRTERAVEEVQAGSGEANIVCSRNVLTDTAFDVAMFGYLQTHQEFPHNVEVYIASDGG